VAFVADHYVGMKVWLNGEAVYAAPKEVSGYGNHYSISRQKLAVVHGRSPQCELNLREGWNRLLVRVSSPQKHLKGWRTQQFTHCLRDSEPVYETKNIVWESKMPERTNACPIVVGDRIFTPAEPDELLCLDKATGKILWRRTNSFFDAIPEAERAANPALKELEPIAKEIAETADYEKGLELRRKVRDGLLAVDKKAYHLKLEGHLSGHFGIVGFTTTPVSDGQHVWAYYGYGVVACYDFDGHRKWIRRLTTPNEVGYSCSPAIIGGKLAVVFNGLYTLDAATGEIAWSDPKAGGIASLLPARIKDTDLVTTYKGQFYRVADGKKLWANPRIIPNDTGWAPGVFLGDTYYLSWGGISGLMIEDFSGVAGDEWKPKERVLTVGVIHKRPNGDWLDRFTAGSPLIVGDTFYGIDQLGRFFALDIKNDKPLYQADVGFDELHTYNAIGVGASAALGGKHIYVVDNQGECVVLEPGPTYKPVATNHIETVVDRGWPWAPQEILSNGPLVFDGKRIYQRGEQYLYCIGEK
jgi:outer membrane protein assembly factor BamB